MYENEETLFGVDMRHRPPLTIMPTEEHGWGGSHGRLAYSQMNRAQESNYSEYALNTMGILPKNYVIVNADEVNVNRESAFKVCHGRVAIPVKEFARQKRLTLKEQWELMNPQWVGTFFGYLGDDPYRSQRKTLEQAMSDAVDNKCFEKFMSQFWSARYGHEAAIERLERRANELEDRANQLNVEYASLNEQIKAIEKDLDKGMLEYYHLQGLNANEHLNNLRSKRLSVNQKWLEALTKARRIKDYINSITF